MQIIKRDGSKQDYSSDKIANAIRKAFVAEEKTISDNELKDIIFSIENEIDFKLDRNEPITVEWIQDRVEIELMKREHFEEVRSYILYREGHTKTREAINGIVEIAKDKNLIHILKGIQKDFKDGVYDLNILLQKYRLLAKEGMNKPYALDVLIRSASELISKEAPKYEYIAARLLAYKINSEVDYKMKNLDINNFYDKLVYLAVENIYGSYLVDDYSKDEILELSNYIDNERDKLFTYAGLELVKNNYLVDASEYGLIEKPQEMYMAISMHLALNENNKVEWAKRFYDALSTNKFVLSSSAMKNARKPDAYMCSSFVDTVPEDTTSIYKMLENYSKVANNGSGMGFYFGKVKASDGEKNNLIHWIKLINDTADIIKQEGKKNNACSCYLDVWHKDLPEFLEIKNIDNNDNYKNILTAICFPDYFWKMAKNNINDNWYLMCPKEIYDVKGYHLEDYIDTEWEKRYLECVKDNQITKRIFTIKEIIRLIIKSVIETGMPFIFNRDLVNRLNPNKHQGIIYSSNLCTEIMQNMSAIDYTNEEIVDEEYVIDKYKTGNYVANNLGSINIGIIDVNDNHELKDVIDVAVRALDNIIDLTKYQIPYAYIYSKNYRSISLGVLGYQHCLVKNGIHYESEDHLKFVDELFDRINFFTLNASSSLAKEKGMYKYFRDSDYDNGEYFDIRNYNDEKWEKLKAKIKQFGLRNGYLLAISPNSQASIIAGTTRGIEPIYSKLYVEERNGIKITRVAPELNQKTYWLYKNAHAIDQTWVIKAAALRQKHIDQSQAMMLYITSEYTYSQLLALYIYAWENGVKSIHYIRNTQISNIVHNNRVY